MHGPIEASGVTKIVCRGMLGGRMSSWATWAISIDQRSNGDLAVTPVKDVGCMGFRAGAWSWRRKIGDWHIYDVDFSRRFQPRRKRK